jgi:flavin-dependent dehydrogenase
MRSITIIGAGPAGATAGVLLARAGHDVTLIEQHRFPRDKVCGECLSALGIDVLERLDLRRTVQKLDPTILTRAFLYAPDGSRAELALPRAMRGVSRLALDDSLLHAARDAGANVIQPARCEAIDPGHVRLRNLETNAISTHNTDTILVADGKAAFAHPRPAPTRDLGVKAHFINIDAPRDAIALFGVRGHYVGLAPIEGGRWNIAMSVPARRVNEHRGDLNELFARIVHENAALSRQMRRAERISRWLTSPLPRFSVARRWPNGVIPVGNAAAALEPIGGEGMGLAMRSAEIATRCLGMGQPIGEFRGLWRTRILACRAAAMAMSAPRVARAAVAIASLNVHLNDALLRLVGKTAAI